MTHPISLFAEEVRKISKFHAFTEAYITIGTVNSGGYRVTFSYKQAHHTHYKYVRLGKYPTAKEVRARAEDAMQVLIELKVEAAKLRMPTKTFGEGTAHNLRTRRKWREGVSQRRRAKVGDTVENLDKNTLLFNVYKRDDGSIEDIEIQGNSVAPALIVKLIEANPKKPFAFILHHYNAIDLTHETLLHILEVLDTEKAHRLLSMVSLAPDYLNNTIRRGGLSAYALHLEREI